MRSTCPECGSSKIVVKPEQTPDKDLRDACADCGWEE